jgi:hypothetical protein
VGQQGRFFFVFSLNSVAKKWLISDDQKFEIAIVCLIFTKWRIRELKEKGIFWNEACRDDV